MAIKETDLLQYIIDGLENRSLEPKGPNEWCSEDFSARPLLYGMAAIALEIKKLRLAIEKKNKE